MEQTRRKFIIGSGAAAFSGMLGQLGAQNPGGPPPDIRSILIGAGFDPDDPEAVLMAVVADTHLNLNPETPTKLTGHLHDGMVADINGLQPPLTHLVFDGDVVYSHGLGTGAPRNETHVAIARQEMQLFNSQLGRFRPDLEVLAVPGNHDTDGQENLGDGVPEVWIEEIGTPYQKRTMAGVEVFFLNSGHAGHLDPVQAQWFADGAAAIPSDREVLIVAHHPSMYYQNLQTGLKRKVAAAFSGHQAPVWIIGGHGHSFGESLFLHQGTRFIQVAVTTANPVQWGDGTHPGYAILGLQQGRVACRLFRSLKEPGFCYARQPLASLVPKKLMWPFDLIEYPAEAYEEGDYDRSTYLINFLANDVVSYFTYLQHIVYQVNLSRFGGKVREFLVSAATAPANEATLSCSFSETGPQGPWQTLPFGSPDAQRIYRIPIPSHFWFSPNLYVRLATSKPRYEADVSLGGWGLAAAGEALNGYEKWISTHYRTIIGNAVTGPLVIPPGSSITNLEHFAFNLPLPNIGTGAPLPPISGLPGYSTIPGKAMNFRFARRSTESQSLVRYDIEQSSDLSQWETVSESRVAVAPLDSVWEEAKVLLPLFPDGSLYCRARVTSLETSEGSSYISAGDADGDGIDDLLQYAFDLGAQSGGFRVYDPARPVGKAGVPIQNIEPATLSRIVHPRMRVQSNPGVVYRIQQSQDLDTWTNVPPELISERILRSAGDWEEVESIIAATGLQNGYYRISLELSDPLST